MKVDFWVAKKRLITNAKGDLIYKGIIVKQMPWFLWWIFSPNKRNALAYNSQIYVSRKVYNDLKKKNSDPFHIAILEHEFTHLERKRQVGGWSWNLKYLFSGRFRLRRELAADLEMMKYLKKRGLPFPIEMRARELSSALYFWMISYSEAKRKLTRIWKTLEIPQGVSFL